MAENIKKKENAERIQTSILNPYEKKALQWMAERLPRWITSDMLTYFSLFAAVLTAAGYLLTNSSPAWLWLASFGIFLHWIGDSLDGTIARQRHQSRPLYGFYIDHNTDCVAEFFLIGGIGFSAYMHVWASLLIFVVYLALEVYVMICAHLKNEFRLTYGKFGPTELRVMLILINTLWFFVPALQDFNLPLTIGNQTFILLSMDCLGLLVFAILLCIYFCSVAEDLKYFANIDPLKKKD